MRTFLIRTIDVDGYAYIAERFFPFRHVFALETRCTQQTDTLKVLRDKTFITLRLAHPYLAVNLDELCVTILVQSRGSHDAIRVWLRERYRTPPARDLFLLSGFTNAPLPGSGAAL